MIVRIGLGLVFLLLTACGAPQALWTATSDVFLIREGEVETEDVYAAASLVKVAGVVEGDLVVLATDRLEVTGRIEGDLIGFAATAEVGGEVGGSVRLVGVDLDVTADVGKDVVGLGREIGLGGPVAGDVLVGAGRLSAGGEVGRDLRGRTLGTVTLTGSVGRDVEMAVGGMRVLEGALVGEDLGYRSADEADIHSEAVIEGAVVHRRPLGAEFMLRAAGLMVWFMAGMLFMAAGILWIRFRGGKVERWTAYLERHPVKSLLRGLALLSPVLLTAGGLVWMMGWGPPRWVLMTGLFLLVLGPFIVLLLLYIAVVGPVPVLIAAGRGLSRGRLDSYGAFLVSALLLGVLLAALAGVPYASLAAAACVVVLGMGTSGGAAGGTTGRRGAMSAKGRSGRLFPFLSRNRVS